MFDNVFSSSRQAKEKRDREGQSLVDLVYSTIRDGRWYSIGELSNSLSLPLPFIKEVCAFLQRYGFADLKDEWVRADPDFPSLQETARFLRSLAGRSVEIPIWMQFYAAPCSHCLYFST